MCARMQRLQIVNLPYNKREQNKHTLHDNYTIENYHGSYAVLGIIVNPIDEFTHIII